MSREAPDLRVGRIARTHGLSGKVQVEPLTDFPTERFARGSRLTASGRSLTVASLENRRDGLIVCFDEISSREQAAELIDAYLTVPLETARDLPEGRYYQFQLVGLSVVDVHTGESLGTVAEVLTYDANDVLRVTAGSREVLIPMVRDIVRSIELSAGRIAVAMPAEDEG